MATPSDANNVMDEWSYGIFEEVCNDMSLMPVTSKSRKPVAHPDGDYTVIVEDTDGFDEINGTGWMY